jgi:hypothetical protein
MGAASKVEPKELLARAERLVPRVPDLSSNAGSAPAARATGADDRAYQVAVLTRIATPVLEAASKGELHDKLPIHAWEKHRAAWTHYEAFARTLAGIAPWLALGTDDSPEGQQRASFIELARRSLVNATDPKSPDHMNFGRIPDQPLCDSAYLSYALLVAQKQLWDPLTDAQKSNVAAALHQSLAIRNGHKNNWILFPAMIETALWQLTGTADVRPIVAAVDTFQQWYLGDGVYGDGPQFRWDYYNSYAIQPMLLAVLRVAAAKRHPIARYLPVTMRRAQRYAQILERLISPEGTFPVMGRSSTYRFAAFFHLADMALHRNLPDALDPGAVRAGMMAVIRWMIEAPGTFDDQGWLTLGSVGAQPGLREDYNATGSLYMCQLGLVTLGLPPTDRFWTAPAAPWTQRRIWAGEDLPRDHALPADLGEGPPR